MSLFGSHWAKFGVGVGSENFLGFMYIDSQLLFSKYYSILVLLCSLSLWWGGVVFLVITVSHPTFCCVGVGVVVEVGLGCDNILGEGMKEMLNIAGPYLTS